MAETVLPIVKAQLTDDTWVWITDVASVECEGLVEHWRDVYDRSIGSENNFMVVLYLDRLSSGQETLAIDAKRIFLCNGATGSTIDTVF